MKTSFKLITASDRGDYDDFKTLLQIYAKTDLDDPRNSAIWKDLAELPGRYAPPTGGVVLARLGTELAGCGALSATAKSGLAEIKRVYVLSAFRRQGLARELTLAAMELARQSGYRAVGIMTWAHNQQAIALYRQLGFEPVPKFRDSSKAHHIFLGLSLTPDNHNAPS